MNLTNKKDRNFRFWYREAGAIARWGGQQGQKGIEGHIQQIFITLFPNH